MIHVSTLILRSSFWVLLLTLSTSLHAAMLHVDQANPNASDSAKGTLEQPFKTINAAAQIATKGDTVIVHPGVYREHVAPGKTDSGVTYISAVRHRAYIKGSDVWTPQWKPVADHEDVYVAPLEASLFTGRRNPFLRTISVSSKDKSTEARPVADDAAQWPITLGQLFVDGMPMTQVTTLKQLYDTPATWIVGQQGDTLLLHLPGHLRKIQAGTIELTTRDRVFAPSRRALRDIIIEGFIFEHCANQGPFPQVGMISTRTGKNWIIRDNIIRYAKTVGIDIGSETWGVSALVDTDDDQKRIMIGGGNQVLNNIIEDNGLCGVAGWNTGGSVIRGNIVRRNNRLGFESKINASWEEAGGIKVHAFNGGVIEGNLVIDNDGPGIWIDNGYKGARISRNFVSGSLGKGIFVELGEGRMLIDNNVVCYTRNYSNFYAGDGIYSHDASDLVITNNLLYHNARYGILGQVVSGRTLGKDKHAVETSNHQILGNMFIGNNVAAISMPFAGKQSRNNTSDYNVFIGSNEKLRIHTNHGRVKQDVIGDAYTQAVVSQKDSEVQPQPTAHWIKDRRLDLASWQKVMKQDQHSIEVPTCRMIIASGEVTMTVMEAASTWTLPMPNVEGVTRDYFARTMGDESIAGPFGKIEPGHNRWILWPVR